MLSSLLLPDSDLREPPQVPLFLAELGIQERLNQVPCHSRPYSATSKAENVDVIVFDPDALRNDR